MIKKIFLFYYEGFKNMKVGKTLWLIILVKLFIMFAILRIFFFENYLGKNFENDKERGEHVLQEIIK